MLPIFGPTLIALIGFDDRYSYFLIESISFVKRIEKSEKIFAIKKLHSQGGRFDRHNMVFEIIYHRDCEKDICPRQLNTRCDKGHYLLHHSIMRESIINSV